MPEPENLGDWWYETLVWDGLREPKEEEEPEE